MKRRSLLSFSFFAALIIGMQGIHSYPTGAPSDGRTGSPGDGGKTCSSTGGCHVGSPVDVSGIISSNVPVEGYTPNTDYTITVTVNNSGNKGFCVSPQALDGTLLGGLTAGTNNIFVGTKYITHKNPIATNPAVWSFTWKSPAKGTGVVDFYGAFANNRNAVRKSKFSIVEKSSTGISENNLVNELTIYPNPSQNNQVNIGFEVKESGIYNLSILDIYGKNVQQIIENELTTGLFERTVDLSNLQSGIYFMQIANGSSIQSSKILIQ